MASGLDPTACFAAARIARLKASRSNRWSDTAPGQWSAKASAERPFEHRLLTVAEHLHRLAARFLAAAGEPGHPAERFQHLLHLHELLQQTIHFFDRRAAAFRDPLAPAAVDDVLLAPFVGRHRADDRFDPA